MISAIFSTVDQWYEKVEAAWKGGCKRFDGAIKGYGGCPMAKDELTGNMPTEKIADYFFKLGKIDLDKDCLSLSVDQAAIVF